MPEISPSGRWMVLRPCGTPFTFNKLLQGIEKHSRQKQIGWGIVDAAGPMAAGDGRDWAKVGAVVVYPIGIEMEFAGDGSQKRMIVDAGQCVGAVSNPVNRKIDATVCPTDPEAGALVGTDGRKIGG